MNEFYSNISPFEFEDSSTDVMDDVVNSAKVILFNDEIHSFDDVIIQLIKAIKCTTEKAELFAFEVHNRGKAVVYSGDMIECIKVSSVLEEIALSTQIEF